MSLGARIGGDLALAIHNIAGGIAKAASLRGEELPGDCQEKGTVGIMVVIPRRTDSPMQVRPVKLRLGNGCGSMMSATSIPLAERVLCLSHDWRATCDGLGRWPSCC